MRGMIGRGLRLLLIATLSTAGIAAYAAVDSLSTQTRLDAHTRILSHQGSNLTEGVLSVSVTGQDGRPATGAVVIEDAGKPLAGAALNAGGTAGLSIDLAEGSHSLRAIYQGDSTHAASTSAISEVTADAAGTPSFQLAINPAALTLTQGQSGSVTVSLTPVNSSALTGPMFVTLSCSGFPDQSSCTFTPQNVEIQPNATAAVTSNMVMATQATGTRSASLASGGNGTALAILIPGALSLAGLAFGARRRGWTRLMLIALIALFTSFGMTACAARYNYYNHGPNYNLPTPAGTYQMLITAQSSNGVTAATTSTSFALTVSAPK